MKKTLLTCVLLYIAILAGKSQTLYGTTFKGGTDGGGSLTQFIPATNNLVAIKSFESLASSPEYTSFLQAIDGKLYGMTSAGGSNNLGVIFSYDPITSNYTKLKDFNGPDGASPFGSLIQATDGKLYGLTSAGGTSGGGVIFSFDPSSATYTKLKDLDSAGGNNPFGSLLQASDNKMYGLTRYGGNNNTGVIFSFDPSTFLYIKLKDFNDSDGANPFGNVIQAKDGKLYGMTNVGGTIIGWGVIFSYDPISSVFTKLKDFEPSDGENPLGSLLEASDGKLYGTTTMGTGTSNEGVVFSFDPNSLIYTKVHEFNSPGDGAFPQSNLVQASDGKLYSMTGNGGSNNAGTIFSYDITNSVYTKLRDLDDTSGGIPIGSLAQASNGLLYGLTLYGGQNYSNGVAFSFDPSSLNYTVIKDFGINKDGSGATAALCKAANGKLYGMTNNGGSHGKGTIFLYDPNISSFSKLYDFDNTNGANPFGSIIQATSGKLYGITSAGGNAGVGVIFTFDPVSLTYKKLYDFSQVTDHDGVTYSNGEYPYGSLLQADDGKLYGLALAEGNGVAATLFSFDPADSINTTLNNFGLPDGGVPRGSLINANDGKIYGTTSIGGSNNKGILFSFNPSGSAYLKVHDFDVSDGANPNGTLTQQSNGKLYGLTTTGGAENAGVIFSFDPVSSLFTSLHDFDNTNGANPYGNLLQAGDGKFYGMTYKGGINDSGVVFSYDPLSSTFMNLVSYTGVNGANPYYGSAFIELANGGPLAVNILSFTGINNGSSNQLSWKVTSDGGLTYFELQRSNNGQNFISVSKIKNTLSDSYTYNDNINASIADIYYYRLKSVGADGNVSYSNIIRLGRNGNFISVNPNPFKDILVATVGSLAQTPATFILTDVSGKELYKATRQLYKGTNVINISETNNLSKGTYVLTISTQYQIQAIKVIKAN